MILVINKNKKEAAVISDMFNFMGLLSYAATPEEALLEISESYRAILISSPGEISEEELFVESLRALAKDVPVFAIDGREGLYNKTFSNKSAVAVFSEIKEYAAKNGLAIPGDYRSGDIDASICLATPQYSFTPLPFTKTETMITRALIHFSKNPKDAKAIQKYAFRFSRAPEASGIRTHVSIINKKFKNIFGKNLITHTENRGYLILTEKGEELMKLSSN